MLALTVSLFLLFGYVEMRRVWQDARLAVEIEETRADAATSSEAFEDSPAERARRAYAIRCSCDGRDS